MLPAATAIGGDLLKYGIDNAQKFINGEEVEDFDYRCSLKNAAFDVVWRNLPGRFFGRFDGFLKRRGGKFFFLSETIVSLPFTVGRPTRFAVTKCKLNRLQ